MCAPVTRAPIPTLRVHRLFESRSLNLEASTFLRPTARSFLTGLRRLELLNCSTNAVALRSCTAAVRLFSMNEK